MKRSSQRKDLFAATVVLLAVVGELMLREMYYRVASEIPSVFGVFGVWVVLIGVVIWISRRGSGWWPQVCGRLAFLAACGVWLAIVGQPALGELALPATQRNYLICVLMAIFAVGAWWSMKALQQRWSVVRRAIAAAATVFVASQPVLAAFRAPTVHWPQQQATAPFTSASKSITVFLLLDELNANAAQPIAEALRKTGSEVRQKTLTPRGDGTAQVIPAMFAHRSFQNAKPCGLQTICSGSNVLDFSKVFASRADIDVVGFYGPYCTMQGLRTCAHLAPSSPVFSSQRWWCAALRRSSWLSDMAGGEMNRECSELGGRIWGEMVLRVEQAIWQAPVWNKGGFLFAHVPLPHPPGEGGGGSINSHYSANLARATALVDHMVQRLAREPKTSFTIVVFSDHPLRQSVWCQSSTQYRHKGCPLGRELTDDKVPLIVAGDIPANFDSIVDNSQVFNLSAK